jgi:hypothetical protein
MAFELTVQIGGLCLLLERKETAATGLFVLMPEAPAHHSHAAVFVYDAGNASGHQGINGHDLTVTGLLQNGGIVGLPAEIAPVSHFAGGVPVASKWTESATLEPGLLSRVKFDLGHQVVPVGRYADMNIDVNNVVQRRNMTGRVELRHIVSDDSITVDDIRLTPDSEGKVFIGFYSAPGGDFHHPGRPHPADEVQPHFASYYALLEGTPTGPLPRTARDHPVPPGFHTMLIDPVQCSLGGGCPTADPC